MNIAETTEKLLYHVRKAQEKPVMQSLIYTNEDPLSARHEFLFFIKPEITLRNEQIKTASILKMVFQSLSDFQFDITDIRLLGAAYLEKFNIIAQHYGVINAMSRNPLEYLTSEGTEKFKAAFGKSPDEVNLFGGLQFLDRYREFDPVSLNEMWQKSKAVKLAGGTYCTSINVGSEQVFLINGFHPMQLVHFTDQGRSIIAFTLVADIDWSIARNDFIGKTNPEDAKEGSLRKELLKHSRDLGLDEVSSSRNGFHLSAGPVEGLVELMRYCSDFSTGDKKAPDDFRFGRLLNEEFSADEVQKICNNGFVVNNGSKISVFDLTEEKNADDALRLLKESKLNQ